MIAPTLNLLLALAAQEAPPADATWSGVVATVNGEAITSADVMNQLELVRDAGLVETEDADRRARLLRQLLAEEILLAAEAGRLGLQMSDPELRDYWTERTGSAPDFEVIAERAGTTTDRQVELARRAALAELYLAHRVGLRSDRGNLVPPDPILSRTVALTPAQIREYFKSNRADFDEPERVEAEIFGCPDARLAEEVRSALAEGRAPPAAALVARESFPVATLERGFSTEVAAFLRDAAQGAVSPPFAREEGVLVFHVVSRVPARPADFAAVQGRLREVMQRELIGRARMALVGALAQDAVYWPEDLFQARASRPEASPP